MEVTRKIYPDITMLLYHSYSLALVELKQGKTREQMRYSLLPAFLDGMLEASAPETEFVDIQARTWRFGWRSPYGYKERTEFLEAYHAVLNGALAATDVPGMHGAKMRVGFGIA